MTSNLVFVGTVVWGVFLLSVNVSAMAIALRPPRVNSRDAALPRVSIQAGEDMNLLDQDGPLTLGKPIAFETPLFRGQVLLRLQSARSEDHDPKRHDEYFAPGRKDRLMQTVLQGQFLLPNIKMSDIYVGSVFTQPLVKKPPAMVAKILEKALKRSQPGAIVDLRADQPKTLAIYAGTAQSLSIDYDIDSLPDMLATDIPENVASHLPFGTASQRVKTLSRPEHAEQYEFDTDHVYTFHSFNEFMDYGTGTIKVPIYGRYNFIPAVGPQPLMVSAVSGEGETVFSLAVHHD
ncbi:expressed unknown protein [Seminavis robusta]|uniref:Domain of unknown function at the cortex 1 domain-containing protein n=1 Tax=Seminavis robusta TaxID=568900 RepID=A0A9N8EK64_9STRA|nr:expressed unknown protein [Seminavis robusta]|eukprot:Sro1094_g240570.1 n/a (291) ;mRNA; r:21093-21965